MGWRREGGRGGDAGRLRFRGGTQNGTSHTVTTTSDHAGRIVVPKAVRDEARLLPGAAIGRAIVVACAQRARAGRILTLNRRDFEALVPRSRIVECPLA